MDGNIPGEPERAADHGRFATRKSHFTHSPLVSRASLSFDDFSLESSSSDHSDSEAMLHVSTSGRPFGRTGMHSRFSPSPAARRAHSPLREFWPNSRAQQQQDADNKAREETSQDGRADSDTEGDENCSYSPEVSSKRTRMAADTSLAALEMLADVAAADAVTAKGSQNVDVMQVRASLRASVKEAAHSVSQLGSAADASATQQMLLRRALSRQGELLIEVQRSQQQYTACAEQLRQAKVESKETRSHARRQAALFDAQKQRVVEELQGAGQREQDLAEEASRSRAEAAELAAELARSQEVCKEMLAARRSARDALSDMAQQNARLVSAYVEKKQELRSIQEAVREERLQWQMRIEDLEAHLHAANSTSISLRTALAHRRTSPTSASPQQAQADGKQDCSPRASPHHDMGNAAGVESTSFPHQPAAETTDGASTHCDRHTPRTNGVCSIDASSPAAAASAERLRAITEQNEKLVRENCQLRQQRQAAEEKSRRAEARQQAERLKQVGNTAFQQQRYQPAADAYTAALELKLDDPAVNAVLYCNRAASLHALGKYVDAIADCFQAAALDPAYIRVYQRRADAYNAIGDYANAAQDLMALMQRGAGDVQDKLMDLQLRAKSHSAANHYAVLGVRPTATPAEVKAAYRQLALKYHPDKASTPTQKAAAEALFKLVSQANSVLSDTERKRQYDASLLRRKYRSRFAAYRF
ncbi:hypothetical protein WJX72_005188 [[Myrmecia] bisecta]|uniref:J domain-containing protein n=1 Tax=[Myrmecia] bisecta TaxID=41462 RepID=A0AAW1R674_9CHLO